MTVKEYLESWLAGKRVSGFVNRRTQERYEQLIREHVTPEVGHLKLTQLHGVDIEALYGRLTWTGRRDGKPGGLSPNTIGLLHRALKRALMDAVEGGLIQWSPADGIMPSRAFPREYQGFTPAEAARWLEASRGTTVQVPVALALTTGLRVGGIAALKWKDMDLDKAVLQVQASISCEKGGAPFVAPRPPSEWRRIPMPHETIETLRAHKERQQEQRRVSGPPDHDYDLVCARSNGLPKSECEFSAALRRLREKFHLPPATLGSFRNCHATLLLVAGVGPRVVAERHGYLRAGLDFRLGACIPGDDTWQVVAVQKLEELLLSSSPDLMQTEPLGGFRSTI